MPIAGRGRLFLISGEPGIGKTWLADEVARHAAERGMRVAWGRCWEGGGAPAYWPWVQVLRSLVVHPDRTRARPPLVTPEIGQLIPELSSETKTIGSVGSGSGAFSALRRRRHDAQGRGSHAAPGSDL